MHSWGIFITLLATATASQSDGLTCNDLRTVLSDGNCCRIESQHNVAEDIIYRQCTLTTPDPAIDIDRTNLTAGYDYCEKGQMLVATGQNVDGTAHEGPYWKCADTVSYTHLTLPPTPNV